MTSVLIRIWQRGAQFLRGAWQSHPDLIAGLVLLAVAVPSRLLLLGSDPPGDVQKHFLWDEGLWAHNARVHELLGVWVADDHNPPLVLAPLYTATLTAVYRLLGFGLVATRLVSAVSGILTCLLLYWAVRAVRPPARALLAALVFTLSYFVITHQRVAYTEAYQLLWTVVGLAGVLWARRWPRWALLGGIGISLAQLVKPSALLLFPAVLGCWLWREPPKDREAPSRSFPWIEAAWFGTGVTIVAVPVATVLLANWAFVWGYLSVSLRNILAVDFMPHVDLIPGVFRLPPSGFAQQSIVQVAAGGILAWQRMLRTRETHPDAIERIAWIWLGVGLLALGLFRFQPDRRFLLLSVPLAILFATAVEGRRAPRIPDRVLPAGASQRFLGGAVLGFALGWATIGLGIQLGIGVAPARWSQLWGAAVLGGSLGSLLLPSRLIRAAAGTRLILLIPIFLLLEPVRFSLHLAHSQHTVLEAARRLAALARDLPTEDRIMVGVGGATLSLESKVFAIHERNNPKTGALMNQNAWDRFHPALALMLIPRGKPHSSGGEARDRGFQPCTTFELLPNERGVPYRRFELWIRPDLASRCTAVAPDPP